MEKSDIIKFECNCKEKWLKTCNHRVTEGLLSHEELDMYPAQHRRFYEEYRTKGIISDTKNDKVLYQYLKYKNILGEKLCYLEISHKLVLKDYKKKRYCLDLNVDSVLDYLYWSYGNPDDTDNLLRRHFVKKAMADYKCNCREKWKNCCINYARALRYVDDMWDNMPALYIPYIKEYTDRGIISQQKNDKILYDYICKNDLFLLEDEICYYTLACKLCIKEIDNPFFDHESNLKFLIDYLVWSYGLPYDENNILRKILKNNSNIDISNHRYKPKDKKESNNTTVKSGYVRDARVRELALQLANFQCEIDKEHDTFISRAILKNYVESHHLIPMKYYDEFQYSIDNEADIVALCPNCHRLLHFGRFEDKKVLLDKLYYKHIESLKKAGIEITLERLLEMYED